MLKITNTISVPDNEIEINAIRAQGPGGQHVNKVSSAIHLRYDVHASSLPDFYKQRLLAIKDKRLTKEGVIIIKAQAYRTQDKNRLDALERLRELIFSITVIAKKRRPTKPSKNARKRRVDKKTQRGKTKALRGRVQRD